MRFVKIRGLFNESARTYFNGMVFDKIDIECHEPFDGINTDPHKDFVIKSIPKNNHVCIFEDIICDSPNIEYYERIKPVLGLNRSKIDGPDSIGKWRRLTSEFWKLLTYSIYLDLNENMDSFKLNLKNEDMRLELFHQDDKNYQFNIGFLLDLPNGSSTRVYHELDPLRLRFKAYRFKNRLIGCYEFETFNNKILNFNGKDRVTLKPSKNTLSEVMYNIFKNMDFDDFDKLLEQGTFGC